MKKTSPSFLDNSIIFFDFDELDEDLSIRKDQIYDLVKKKYEEVKQDFESSPEYSGIVKNGTYARSFDIADPATGCTVRIRIVVQRYKRKATNRSFAFYGGIFLARLPYLICQAMEILIEMASYGEGPHPMDAAVHSVSRKPSVREHCKVWGITVRLYYRFRDRIREGYFPGRAWDEAKGILARLYPIPCSQRQEALKELLRPA